MAITPNRRDIYHSGSSVDALANDLGMDAESLATSLGQPREAEKQVVALGPVRSYVVLTDGGLAVNEKMEVLNASGNPITGLFAAGSAGQGGLLLFGHGHHLGWAFVSGRIAGRSASFYKGISA